jgi:integrase
VQNYDWGKLGATSSVARLWSAATEPRGAIDEARPYAELWLGTHPSGPARLAVAAAAGDASAPGPLLRDHLERLLQVQGAPNEDAAPGRALSISEIRALVRAASSSARDGAALALCYGAGLRRSEAVTLPVWADKVGVAPDGVVHVLGKGGKHREVPLGPRRLVEVRRWMVERIALAPKHTQLLCASSGRQLSAEGLDKVLVAVARRAGIARFTPHDLRRSYITHLLDRGVDVLTVSRLAGHNDPKTTALYDRRGAAARSAAAATLEGDEE